MEIRAKKLTDYKVVRRNDRETPIYPYLREDQGAYSMKVISPNHGRSFLLKKVSNLKWIIGKGNGLGFSTHPSLINSSMNSDTWGRLSLKDAVRDFDIGNEIRSLGIKTNCMEYVLELPFNTIFNGNEDKAALLQYSVQCPYRIVDAAFIPHHIVRDYADRWTPIVHAKSEDPKHIISADVLFYNLSILHSNLILHNAITPQNYTWALELLDFEASHTPANPFRSKEYQSFIPMLRDLEVIQTYEIINYIAWCLNEIPDYHRIEKILNLYKFHLT